MSLEKIKVAVDNAKAKLQKPHSHVDPLVALWDLYEFETSENERLRQRVAVLEAAFDNQDVYKIALLDEVYEWFSKHEKVLLELVDPAEYKHIVNRLLVRVHENRQARAVLGGEAE